MIGAGVTSTESVFAFLTDPGSRVITLWSSLLRTQRLDWNQIASIKASQARQKLWLYAEKKLIKIV